VVERDGKSQPIADPIAQREVAPSKVRGDNDESFLTIQWTRGADADSEEITPAGIRFSDGVEHHAFDETNDAVRDTVGAKLRACGNRAHGERVLAVHRHRAHDDVRAAQVNADDVL